MNYSIVKIKNLPTIFNCKLLGEGDHVLARAEYDFEAENDEELAFHAGDMLRLAPKDKQPRVKGWLLASLNGTSEGLVPANYIKVCIAYKGDIS